ncbi:hypothetical protein F4827_003817 [Paraburkholderia bannensis]|uniref:Uncharacterized protein n=1 Tax=Paraburkholderia bannensis TaxID=765414 RepID=A0A7W9WU34_9BURK|nr:MULTISPECIES: hypothetical protein [Paraburkholderia]MBB3258948.1 hypothetical protein [Paraburkholderia sp. WP4_3_2]MBB6103962.1 hypothetical protein [Paraburkholderia bannensis]
MNIPKIAGGAVTAPDALPGTRLWQTFHCCVTVNGQQKNAGSYGIGGGKKRKGLLLGFGEILKRVHYLSDLILPIKMQARYALSQGLLTSPA